MDPITAVGAVASIITLAQTALSLSKALYTLGSAVQSASEDIEALADDLKTFAQSLNLLSRLLEDSKSWYSDDVYLLTAKIIKDCADLYEKIDKILVKLGGNGKNTWKIRMKFVYKEGQIRKLMKRLRDMKGNLATVLMSLQVDLQLSLLNISSSSKIQRSPEKELDSETIRHLKAAQDAVESCNFLPKYSSEFDLTLNDEESHQAKVIYEPRRLRSFAPSNDTHSFISLSGSHEPSDTAAKLVCKSNTGPLFAQLNPTNHEKPDKSEFRSLKSVSSTESFKSAVSVQKELLDLAHEVKAVKSVLHAFRTALDTLDNLIERRIPNSDACYLAALQLKTTLFDGQKQVEDTNLGYCKEFGIHYVKKWEDATKLHDISFHMMRVVVTSLHMLSAEHEVLNIDGFEALWQMCEKCRGETVGVLYEVAYYDSSQQNIAPTPPCPTYNIYSQKPRTPNTNEPQRKEAPQMSLPFGGYTFKRFESNYEPPVTAQPELPKPEVVLPSASPPHIPMIIPNSRDLVGPCSPRSGLGPQYSISGPAQQPLPPSLGRSPSNFFGGIGAGPSSMPAPDSTLKRPSPPNPPVSIDAMDSLLEKLRASAPQGQDQRDRRRRLRLKNSDQVRVASGQNSSNPDEGGTIRLEDHIGEQPAMILQTQQEARPEFGPAIPPGSKIMKGLKRYRARRLEKNKKGFSLADPKAQKNGRIGEDKFIDIPTATFHPQGATDYSSQKPVMNGCPSTAATPNPNNLEANFCSHVNDDEEDDLEAATGLEAMRVAEEQERVGASTLIAGFAYAQQAHVNHSRQYDMAYQQNRERQLQQQQQIQMLQQRQAVAFQQQNPQFQLQQQQQRMIQQQQHARQMMAQQHYSDGMPNQQLSQAQYQAMQKANPGMARPVNLPQHLQQAQAGLKAQHTLEQRQQAQIQHQHQQQLIALHMAMQQQAAQRASINLPSVPLHSPAYSPTSPGIELSFDSFQPSDNDFGLEPEHFNFDRVVVDEDQKKDEEMEGNTEANLTTNHLPADLDGSAPCSPVSPGAMDSLREESRTNALKGRGERTYDSQTETSAITKFMVPCSLHGASDTDFAYEDNSDLYDSSQPLPPSEIGPYSGVGYELSSFIEPREKEAVHVHAMENSESSKSPSPVPHKMKRVNTRQKDDNDENQRKKTPSSIKKPEEAPPGLFYPLGDLQQVQVQEGTPNSRFMKSLKRSGRGGRGGFSGRKRGKSVSSASPSHEEFNESFRHQRESLVSKSGLQTKGNSDLWSTAYESMHSSKAMDYIILSIEMETLGIQTLPRPNIAKNVSKLVRDIPTVLNYDPNFAEVLATRDSIIAILKMVDEQLGFELALIGWSCVWKLLSNHEDLLSPDNRKLISTLKTTYDQLLEITGLIARYAVMENLYRNSPTMTLKPEYESALCHLCLTMLFYFSSAFGLRRAQLTEVKTDGGMNEPVFSEEHKLGLEKQLEWKCGALLGDIRVADDLCRGFKVVVDVKEDSESEMSGEDGSDGSWEQVGDEDGMSDAIVV